MTDSLPLIPLARPFVGEEEAAAVRDVILSRTLARGPMVAEFERAMADYVGAAHAIATTSATTALHLALVALGIGPADEILVPDFTFPATANVVVQQGARPILVDVQLNTFNIDLDDLRSKITPRSKAIMPVHAFGRAADMGGIMDLAARHGLAVIEDAACAIGTQCQGGPCGGLGHVGCFSFHPRKVITTGEGGMITTSDDGLAEKMRLLRNHGGRRVNGRFVFEAAGFNYWMSDLQAAVGVAQMQKLDQIHAIRRGLAGDLSAALAGALGVLLPQSGAPGEHIFQSYVVLLDERIDRDAVIARMRADGIETTIGTYALHSQPYYRHTFGYHPGDLPNAQAAFQRSLALPLFPELKPAEILRIAESLRGAIENCSATLNADNTRRKSA